ncbi:CTNA3 protein, partial [Polyodon spathula]|nr:CTNA3 protein [Polyodon spathula]
MSTLQNIQLKIDPKDLQIRTITVERLLEPLIIQVTTLVNCPKYPSNNKKGCSKRGRVLLKSVEDATLSLIEKGEKIARETAVLKEELTAAVEEVRRESISLTRTAREFTEDPCHLSKREAVVQAARALLAAVTRLLILADIIDVIFLLQYLTTVQKTFDFLRATSNKAELKKANQKFGKELEVLDKLAYKRQQNRHVLSWITDCIKFCGSHDLTLRGHDDTKSSLNYNRGLCCGVFHVFFFFNFGTKLVTESLKQPKRTDVLDKLCSSRIPSSGSARWNFKSRTVNTVYESQNVQLQCLEKIQSEDSCDDGSVHLSHGLAKLVKDEDFFFSFLKFFHFTTLHIDIFYNALQKWCSNTVAVKHSLDNFTKSVTEIKEGLSTGESETETGPPTKRLNSNNTPLPKEASDLMILQAKEQFQKTNHLMPILLIQNDSIDLKWSFLDLKSPDQRDEIAGARASLKQNSALFYSTSSACLEHPDVASLKSSKDSVSNEIQNALTAISNAAQGIGRAKVQPTSASGTLGGALDDLESVIIIDPLTVREESIRPALEKRLEAIISGAALLADSSCTRDLHRERIITECNVVRQALQELLSEYINNVSNPTGVSN